MHCPPFREVSWQHPPGTAPLQKIQQGTPDFVQVYCPRLGLLPCVFKEWSDFFKLLPADITGVGFSAHRPNISHIRQIMNRFLPMPWATWSGLCCCREAVLIFRGSGNCWPVRNSVICLQIAGLMQTGCAVSLQASRQLQSFPADAIAGSLSISTGICIKAGI